MSPDLAWAHIFNSLQLSKVEIAELVFLTWRIWKARCWSCYDHVQYLPGPLVRQLRQQQDEWAAATNSSSRGGYSHGRPRPAPPSPSCPAGGVLIHFDGATRHGEGGCIGFVGFSEAGSPIYACGKYYESISDPFLMELLALRDAMDWCLTRGIVSVCFCGDSQLVIRRVSENIIEHDRGGAILEEVRVLKSSFTFIRFVFSPRRTNRAAHCVAKTALASANQHLADFRYLFFNFV
ncbi:unnamed protein product [Linum trigynum]|uniref:RNase H type-1 domain-containing protein n=1 Tax=Linum trigynum TaxID=586398 RepID=A0AAV2G2Q3_9ROSI